MIRNLFLEDGQFEYNSVKSQIRAGSVEDNNSCRILENCRQVQDQLRMMRLGSSACEVGKNHQDDQSTIYSSSQTSSPTNNCSPIKCFESEDSNKDDERCCLTPLREQRFSLDSTFSEDSTKSKSQQINSLKHLVEAEEELQNIWKNSLPKKAIVKPVIIQNKKDYTTSSKSFCQENDVRSQIQNKYNENNFVNPEQHSTLLQSEDLQKKLLQTKGNSLIVTRPIPERPSNPFSKYESFADTQKNTTSSFYANQLSCSYSQQQTSMKQQNFSFFNESLNNQDILIKQLQCKNDTNCEQAKQTQQLKSANQVPQFECTDLNLTSSQNLFSMDDYQNNFNSNNYYSPKDFDDNIQYNMYSYSSSDSEEQYQADWQLFYQPSNYSMYQSPQLNYQFVNDNQSTFQNHVHMYTNYINLTQSTY